MNRYKTLLMVKCFFCAQQCSSRGRGRHSHMQKHEREGLITWHPTLLRGWRFTLKGIAQSPMPKDRKSPFIVGDSVPPWRKIA